VADQQTTLSHLWFVYTCIALIIDETIAHKVQTIDNVPKCQDAYLNIRTLVDNSILTLDGEKWHRLRKLFNPAFSPAHLETLVPQMVAETLVFVRRLESASKQGTTVLMLKELMVTIAGFRLLTYLVELHTRYYWMVNNCDIVSHY